MFISPFHLHKCLHPSLVSVQANNPSTTALITILIPLLTLLTAGLAMCAYLSARTLPSLRVALLIGGTQALDAFIYFYTGSMIDVDSPLEKTEDVCYVSQAWGREIVGMRVARWEALSGREAFAGIALIG
jgi:hypothetical protein